MHFRPRVCCVGGHKKAMWWKKYNPDGVMTHRVVWLRWVGAVDVVWVDCVAKYDGDW